MRLEDANPHERLLVAAAGAVLSTLRSQLERQALSNQAIAALRLLEFALAPYDAD